MCEKERFALCARRRKNSVESQMPMRRKMSRVQMKNGPMVIASYIAGDRVADSGDKGTVVRGKGKPQCSQLQIPKDANPLSLTSYPVPLLYYWHHDLPRLRRYNAARSPGTCHHAPAPQKHVGQPFLPSYKGAGSTQRHRWRTADDCGDPFCPPAGSGFRE